MDAASLLLMGSKHDANVAVCSPTASCSGQLDVVWRHVQWLVTPTPQAALVLLFSASSASTRSPTAVEFKSALPTEKGHSASKGQPIDELERR